MHWAGGVLECPLLPATLSCPSQLEDLETRVVEILLSRKDPQFPNWEGPTAEKPAPGTLSEPLSSALALSPESFQYAESTRRVAPPKGGAPRRL